MKAKPGQVIVDAALPVAAVEAASADVFGPDWLSGRFFRFVASAPDRVVAPAVRFSPNGVITGYANFNEAGWRLIDGQLVILRQDGVASCVASPRVEQDGAFSLVGAYLFEPEIEHRFQEIRPRPGRADVFSFDLFDTLVARRCHDPIAIFRAVEAKSGTADFARLRQALEAQLWNAGDYDLNDIYRALGAATGWPQGALDVLRALELVEEWDNLVPIAQMTARVGPNDLILSDMYLPEGFLRRVIDQVLGLPGRRLHVSSHGKHRGDVWPRLAVTHRILRHHGDNAQSDVRSASLAGLEAEHVVVADWTSAEAILIRAGMSGFASAIREARLRYDAPDLETANAARAQFELNLPLLLVASVDVLSYAQAEGIDTLLFCARDCHLWARLMQILAPRWQPAPTMRYIHASRALLLSGGEGYERYFAKASGRRTLIVDVSGTGRSPAHFIAESGRVTTTRAYLVARGDDVAPEMDAIAPARPEVAVRALASGVGRAQRLIIESFNMPLDGRTLRMDAIEGGFETHALPSEFGARSRAFIEAMGLAFTAGLAAITRHAPKAPSGVAAETIESACADLIALAPAFGWMARPLVFDMERGGAAVVAQTERVQDERLDETDPVTAMSGLDDLEV